MQEDYTRQALPSKMYRELLGSAVCVFNSNNAFIIENILKNDQTNKYNWYDLIDCTSGKLSSAIKDTITRQSNTDIAKTFNEIIGIRNRIMHSFQVTSYEQSDDVNGQILATKYKGGVLKSMLTSDIAIIDIEEYQIKHLKVVIKLL